MLQLRPSIDAMDVYFGAKRAERAGTSTFATYVRAAQKRAKPGLVVGGKMGPYRVYENPLPTFRSCGALLDLKSAFGAKEMATVLGGGKSVPVEEAKLDQLVEEA